MMLGYWIVICISCYVYCCNFLEFHIRAPHSSSPLFTSTLFQSSSITYYIYCTTPLLCSVPTASDCPAYVKRIARSMAALKAAQPPSPETPQKPLFRFKWQHFQSFSIEVKRMMTVEECLDDLILCWWFVILMSVYSIRIRSIVYR